MSWVLGMCGSTRPLRHARGRLSTDRGRGPLEARGSWVSWVPLEILHLGTHKGYPYRIRRASKCQGGLTMNRAVGSRWIAAGRGRSETGPYAGVDARTKDGRVGDPPLREIGDCLGGLGAEGLWFPSTRSGQAGRGLRPGSARMRVFPPSTGSGQAHHERRVTWGCGSTRFLRQAQDRPPTDSEPAHHERCRADDWLGGLGAGGCVVRRDRPKTPGRLTNERGGAGDWFGGLGAGGFVVRHDRPKTAGRLTTNGVGPASLGGYRNVRPGVSRPGCRARPVGGGRLPRKGKRTAVQGSATGIRSMRSV